MVGGDFVQVLHFFDRVFEIETSVIGYRYRINTMRLKISNNTTVKIMF